MDYIFKEYGHTLNQELGMVDSTTLETSKPYRRGKVHRTAKTGYSSLGMFKGFKLHVLSNEKGLILADSGYVGQDVYHQCMMKNIQFIAKLKSNMMADNESGLGYLPPWKKHFKKLYRKRMSIERLFNHFKDNLNMVLNKLHSTKALYTHVISTLLANQMMKTQNISYKVI